MENLENKNVTANPDICIGCGACISICPVEAISFDDDGRAKINPDICIKCGACQATCPVMAIVIE